MTVATLLDEAERHGARLVVVEGTVRVTAPAPLPDDLIERLRQHKHALARLLAANDDDHLPPGPCASCVGLNWWRDGSTWHCFRCSPPSTADLAVCETYVADPSDPPQPPADRRDSDVIRPPAKTTVVAFGVRCIDCQHHQRTDPPHLVRCELGIVSHNATRQFWDTGVHQCDRYERIDQ